MLAEAFDRALLDAMTKPPVDDGKPNGPYAHAYLGRHKLSKAKPYRRGKNRCLYCGAPLSADDGPVDEDRHLSPRERMIKVIYQPSPLLAYLKRKAPCSQVSASV